MLVLEGPINMNLIVHMPCLYCIIPMLTGSFCFQITKKHVDNYQPRRRIPHCELSARMATSKTDLAPLHYRVKMIGAREPYNRFTIVMDHPSLSQTSSVKRLMRRASGTSLIHLLPPLDALNRDCT